MAANLGFKKVFYEILEKISIAANETHFLLTWTANIEATFCAMAVYKYRLTNLDGIPTP